MVWNKPHGLGMKCWPVSWLKKDIRDGELIKLYIRHFDSSIIIAQIYVDEIFGSASSSEVQEFVNQMREEFEISMVGELNFFLGLQMKQS